MTTFPFHRACEEFEAAQRAARRRLLEFAKADQDPSSFHASQTADDRAYDLRNGTVTVRLNQGSTP